MSPKIKNNSHKIKVIVLYAELAQYVVSALNVLADKYNVEVHIFSWDVNPDAPFSFRVHKEIVLKNRSHFTVKRMEEYVEELTPDLIFSSGWMDKGYLSVCKKWRNKIPVVVGMDNHWNGNIKQRIARISNRLTIQRWFNHAWVAGKPQKEYARKLGFCDSNILEGVYTADVDQFLPDKNSKDSEAEIPHRFLYVGRYIERKGVREMWDAFIALCNESNTDWELWCCGTGPLEEHASTHNKIRHLGFVQPDEMKEVIKKCSVFILPSHHEPWGVVVHEFAAAEFPLLCSTTVGAATQFLKEGENGFYFNPSSIESLKNAMKTMMAKNDDELKVMGEKSRKLAMQNSPEIWAQKLMGLIQENAGGMKK